MYEIKVLLLTMQHFGDGKQVGSMVMKVGYINCTKDIMYKILKLSIAGPLNQSI
jgi:hypothetical protein